MFGCQDHKGEIEQYELAEDGGVSFRGIINGKMGYAYTEKIDEASIPYMIKNATENASVIDDEDVEEIFAGSDTYEQGNFFSAALSEVGITERIQFIKDVEREVLAYDSRIVATDYCMFRSELITKTLANNKGLTLTDQINYCYAHLLAIANNGQETKSAFEFYRRIERKPPIHKLLDGGFYSSVIVYK